MITTDQFICAINECDTKLVEQYVTEQRQLAVEEALRVLPSAVHSLVLNTARIKDLRDKFFTNPVNKDLADRPEFFTRTLELTEARNPGLDYVELLPLAAIEARKKLSELNLLESKGHIKPSLEQVDHLANMFEEKP